MRSRARPLADPFYYLRNFEAVLTAVSERYADLLNDAERRFIADFAQVPQASRALLVRMVMRKGDLFRAGKLSYAEIGAADLAAGPLVAAGWVDDRPALCIDELRMLLTKPELSQMFALTPAERKMPKAALGTVLRLRWAQAQPYDLWCGGTDRVYRLLAATLCERFRLIFFGNFRQDWSEFVLADLGIFTYEKVASAPGARAFHCRRHIEDFETLYRCRERLHAGQPLHEVREGLPPPIADCDWLAERRSRLEFQVARGFERAGDAAAAAELYEACRHPGARIRAIRLKERARHWAAARELALRARQEVLDVAEQQQLARLLPRLERKLGLAVPRSRPGTPVPRFDLCLERPETPRAVELLVRDHLAGVADGAGVANGASVRYVENGLINSLFGLLCWDAIFAPIPGAFFHDFHRAPADFASGHFYRRRQHEFAACLALLEEGGYRQAMRRTFARKSGIESPFVAWGLLSEELLECALECFPPAHLRRWFEWIAHDVRHNRAGFPDLVQFWPAQGRYRLIEVKGPGDRLQDNQRRLLEYCVEHDMPVAVCHVRWADAARA